ncbi:MAG: hypothetical protein RR803_01540 [Malacoplasma sp.]
MFKSKCKKISSIDYDKSFLVTKLFADQNMLQAHQERLIKILNNPSEEMLRKHMDAIVLKENAFNAIMEYLVDCFEFKFDKDEIELFKVRFSQQMSQKIEDVILTDIATKLISKGLVFNALAEENKIGLDDDETKLYLDSYYKATNNSINDFLNNPQKFQEIKSVILEEKITQWLLSKFKVEFNLDPELAKANESAKPSSISNKKDAKKTKPIASKPQSKDASKSAKPTTKKPQSKVATKSAKPTTKKPQTKSSAKPTTKKK